MDDVFGYGLGEGFGFNAYLYATLYDVVAKKSHKLGRWVPDFLIKESLKHFEKREQYEKCSTIKSYFERNPARVFPMSRTDWMDYGWRTVYAH